MQVCGGMLRILRISDSKCRLPVTLSLALPKT